MTIAGETSIDPAMVRAALDRASDVLWQTQRPDGSWESPCDMGVAPTAQVLVALHHAGRLSPQDGADGARWLRGRQEPDGSYRAFPTAPHGDLGTTASAWAAMYVCAPKDSADAIDAAKTYVDGHGGTSAVVGAFARGDPAVVYLALAGLVDPSELPCPPMLPALLASVVTFMESRFHSGILMGSGALTLIVHRLRGDWGTSGPPPGALARRFAARTLTLLGTFQNLNGSWNASTVQTALILPAVRAAGLPADHPMVARTMAWLESQFVRDDDGLHVDAFGSPVWCTAANVRALLAAGASPSDPGMVRALDWLVGVQSLIEQPEVDNRNPGAPRVGGWAFQPGNETMVDNDDTGAVVTAFGEVLAAGGLETDIGRRVRTSLELGRDWLLGMQNPDGGWSAFVHGLPAKRPGPLFSGPVEVSLEDPVAAIRTLIDPPRELGDPSTEDLTGRVLDGLGRIGLTTSRRRFGARSSSCAPSSSTTAGSGALDGQLSGLDRLCAPGPRARRRRHVRAVGPAGRRLRLPRQNADGGWGELPDSYRDPALAGRGPSMPPLTGLVLTGLIDSGEGASPPSRAGSRTCSSSSTPTGAGRTTTGSRRSCRPTPSTSWPRRPSTIRPRRSPATSRPPDGSRSAAGHLVDAHGRGQDQRVVLPRGDLDPVGLPHPEPPLGDLGHLVAVALDLEFVIDDVALRAAARRRPRVRWRSDRAAA